MPPKRKRKTGKATKPMTLVPNAKQKTLTREIELSALNTKRYRRLWREMLMRVKMPTIQRKIAITWQTLEHTLDLKDYSISLLMDSLQEAENQRRKANGAHTDAMYRSLKTHEARLQTIDKFFYRNMGRAFVDKTHEFENINYYRSRNEAILRKIALLVNRRSENAASIARSTAISKMIFFLPPPPPRLFKNTFNTTLKNSLKEVYPPILNKGKVNAFVDDGQNERRLVATLLQKKLEDIWDDLRNIFFDYRKSTEKRRKIYETIRWKDEFDRQAIVRQGAHITYILEEIARFREKIRSYRIAATNELHHILRESNFIHSKGRTGSVIMNDSLGREKDEHRAMIMTKEYNSSVKYLNDSLIKAKRILVYMQICRKYETQDEKILPAVADCVTLERQSTVIRDNGDDGPSIDLVRNLQTLRSHSFFLARSLFTWIAEDFGCLTNFWHRLGFVRLITAELRIERERLLKQTKILRNSVKRCFTDRTRSCNSVRRSGNKSMNSTMVLANDNDKWQGREQRPTEHPPTHPHVHVRILLYYTR
ncbi:dynein regulatory complex subunit 2 [Calliopsis andreniformis]|uniref:dynein regulatory complex subunit 2 n=1 Tax=Calliopsis andreniformis TaxID=337506 RepID=UPI003FCE10A4